MLAGSHSLLPAFSLSARPAPLAPILSVGLGLIAATTWGGSDFAGGIGARRSPALLVTASGHLVTLIVLLAVCSFGHLPIPNRVELLQGAAGGLEGSLALALFYRALAMGAMGLTAALTGLLTALVPVLFGLYSEGLPAPLAAAGLLLGVLAIGLICHSGGHSGSHSAVPAAVPSTVPSTAHSTAHSTVHGPVHVAGGSSARHTPAAALWMGALSGAGFGLQLILLKLAAHGGVLWALTSARIGGVLGLLVVLAFALPRQSKSRLTWTGFWKLGILAGALDTIGNVGYTIAANSGRLDLAAIVSSLYPGFTMLLAALLLREHPTRRQTLGMAAALAAVLLLSL